MFKILCDWVGRLSASFSCEVKEPAQFNPFAPPPIPNQEEKPVQEIDLITMRQGRAIVAAHPSIIKHFGSLSRDKFAYLSSTKTDELNQHVRKRFEEEGLLEGVHMSSEN